MSNIRGVLRGKVKTLAQKRRLIQSAGKWATGGQVEGNL